MVRSLGSSMLAGWFGVVVQHNVPFLMMLTKKKSLPVGDLKMFIIIRKLNQVSMTQSITQTFLENIYGLISKTQIFQNQPWAMLDE